MKRLRCGFVFAALAVSGAAGAERIEKVVVFADRAQVTRLAVARCGHGTAAVAFEGLPGGVDEASVRAAVQPGELLTLRVEPSRERPPATTSALDERRAALDLRAAEAQDELDAAGQAAKTAGALASLAAEAVARELAAGTADPAVLSSAIGLAEREKLDAAARSAAAEAALAQVRREKDALAAQRSTLPPPAPPTLRAEAVVRCSGEAEVRLTYLVAGAEWSPGYEARASASDVELSVFATLRQSTGEAWSGAHVSLSTADPVQDATPPKLRRLAVGARESDRREKALVQREERVAHVEARKAGPAAATSAVRVASQGASVQLEVPGGADVAGDGTPSRLFVGAWSLPARFALRSAPKVSPVVFRAADLVNGAPFALLAGPLDAYRDGGLVGRLRLPRVAEGEPFRLAFGLEEGVRVRRLVLDETARDEGLFHRGKRLDFRYRFRVQNRLAAPVALELTDHLPVSEVADVGVEIAEATAKERAVDEDGLVTFPVALAAGESKEVDLAFSIHVPANFALLKK